MQSEPLPGTSEEGNAGKARLLGKTNGTTNGTIGANDVGTSSDKTVVELKCDMCELTFRYISDVYCHQPCVLKRRLSRVKDNMSRFYIQMRPTVEPIKKKSRISPGFEPLVSNVDGGVNDDEDILVVSERAKVGRHLCDFCTFSFSTETELQNHLSITHLDMVDLNTDFEKLYDEFLTKNKLKADSGRGITTATNPKVFIPINPAKKRKEPLKATNVVAADVVEAPPKRNRRKQAINLRSPCK